MKIRIMTRDDELIAEYVREKNFHRIRKEVLVKLLSETSGNVTIFMDTQTNIKELPHEEIVRILDQNSITYVSDEVERKTGGILGFVNLIPSKKKNRKTDLVIFADFTGISNIEQLYDSLLMNYDYAVCIDTEKTLEELSRRDMMSTLFNKEIFKNTTYDSVALKRLRADAPYDTLEILLNDLKSKK